MIHTVLAASLTTLFVMVPVSILVRPFSKRLYHRIISQVLQLYWSSCLFIVESMNAVDIRYYGDCDKLPENERALVLSNHRCHGDWLYLWPLAIRKHALGSFKPVIRADGRHLPIYGWALKLGGILFVQRKLDRQLRF
eukprot:gene20226-1052_t